jgi:subtilisin family serine protease
MTQLCTSHVRRKAVWGPRRIVWPLLILLLGIAPQIASADGRHIPHRPIKKPGHLGKFVKNYHLDDALEELAKDRNGSVNTSRVIVELKPGHELPPEFKNYVRRFAVGGSADGTDHNLDLINGVLLELPNNLLKKLASKGEVFRVHLDRPIMGHVYRTSITVGARTVQDFLGYTGKGIGVAVIDSGITNWHDDLTNKTSTIFP